MTSYEYFKIPPGYTFLSPEERCPKHAEIRYLNLEVTDVLDGKIKKYRRDIAFTFDSKNSELNALQEDYKKDTKDFQKALKAVFNGRPPLSFKRRNPPQGSRRMFFELLPLHFSSPLLPKDIIDRKQGIESMDNFALHFDKGRLQEIRVWRSHELYPLDSSKNIMRISIRSAIFSERDFFESHYGNWEKMAQKMFEILNRPDILSLIEKVSEVDHVPDFTNFADDID